MSKKIESIKESCDTLCLKLNSLQGEFASLRRLKVNLIRALADSKDASNKRLYEQMLKKTEKPYRSQEKRVDIIKKKYFASLKKLMASQQDFEICS